MKAAGTISNISAFLDELVTAHQKKEQLAHQPTVLTIIYGYEVLHIDVE
ncbi:hypothetical protein MKX62_04280 [Sporosarcina sp. FSL K6-5500]